MGRTARGLVVLLAVVAMVAAACGSSSSDDAGGSSSGTVKIGTLWEVKGESSVAIDDYENAAKLAIDEINAAGGVNGKPVERFRVPTSVTDFQKTQAALLEAIDKNPSIIVGFALPAQLQVVSAQITRSQIPVVATTNGEPFIRFGAENGSEYLWIAKTYDPSTVTTGVNYLVEKLGLNKIGIMATNESNGKEGLAAAEQALADHGLEPYATATYPPTSTDLTSQVLQMKGADGVVHWGFPNTIPVQLRQFEAAGMEIPTLGNDSAGIAVASGLVKGDALKDLYVASSCNPADPTSTPGMAEFAKKYQERYGTAATTSGAIVYDAIYLAVDAVKKAGSTDPVAVNEAMSEISRPNGACGNYKADGAHLLNHQVIVSRYNPDGTNTTLERVQVPAQPKVE